MAKACRRGHELILGETAYSAAVWTPCTFTGCRHPYANPLYEDAHREDTSGDTRWNPEVGRLTWAKPGAWEHRRIELRCRECNRQRVAALRATEEALVCSWEHHSPPNYKTTDGPWSGRRRNRR